MAIERVWYARAIPLMGTKQDRQNLLLIKQQFPGAQVDFASLRECGKNRKKEMHGFFAAVDGCDAVVVAEVREGKLSAGAFAESQHARHQGKPVKVIRDGELKSVRNLIVTAKSHQEDWADVTLY